MSITPLPPFSQEQWLYLKLWLEAEDSQPPLLVHGGSEEQLQRVAETLSLYLACQADDKPCGACVACHQVGQQTHPDSIIFSAIGAAKGISRLREIFHSLSRTAVGKKRLVAILAIDTLSLPALNILLKSLEEPAASTRFFLTSRFPRRLPLTIHSRCHHLSLALTMRHPQISAAAWSNNLLIRLKVAQTAGRCTPEMLEAMGQQLSWALGQQGPTPALRQAFQRLRDYHKVTAMKGNEKLARDILFASLPDIPHTNNENTLS